MIALTADGADAGVRIAVLALFSAGALYASIRFLWRLFDVVDTRFESILARRSDDVARLESELVEERAQRKADQVRCDEQLADVRAEVARLRDRLDRPSTSRTRSDDA